MKRRAAIAILGLATGLSCSVASAEEFAGCREDGLAASDMVGNWRVDTGNAIVSGVPMSGGNDPVRITSAMGSGVTATIDGRRITLGRADASDPAPSWKAGPVAPLSSDQLGIAIGCDLGDVARWSGQTVVSARGRSATVDWNLIGIEPDWAILQYSLAATPSAFGYFAIVRDEN